MSVAASGRSGRTSRRRGAAAVLLLVVGTVLTPAALVGNWLRSTVFDTSGYVDAVAPLADNATVRSAVADALTTALTDGADLPAPTSTVLRPLVHASVQRVLSTDASAEVWTTTTRVVHRQIRLFLTDRSRFLRSTGGTVAIPVGALLGPVRAAIQDDLPDGVRDLVDRTSASTDTELVLIDSPALARVQRVLAVANAAGVVLPVAALATVLAAIAVSPRRRSTVLAAGTLVAVSGALVLSGVVVLRTVVIARAPEDQRDLLGALFDALTGPLRHEAGLVGTSGLVLVAAAVIGRRTCRPA